MTFAEKKLACKRLSALELAEKLGNVSEAYRRRGVKSHPQTTPPEVVEQILEFGSGASSSRGCNRLSDHLQLTGMSVSGVTRRSVANRLS